ncbi:ABC transporter ATP-binding protein [Curtobacterium sp. YR515]|uniref:ABC transporter ATP-binding protein n=1 Tax=Curtobacterium sp. YR515 TaxID=1855316 RepID=UPI0008F2DDB5|nr:ABC transporter ATP-binding protein [Curtobacterium sp. YR515]SFF53337.1 ABC-2 type transport system ATP-binding protein [Curtobacterium sp. YR515]
MDDVVVASGLVKTFGRARALDGLDLRVAAGEVHGFLGPNGAGKSTTVRVLLGLLRASGGSVRVFGRDPWRDAVPVHADLASVPGDVALWPNLTGGETIDLLTGLRGGAVPELRARLVRDFDLDTRKHARSYSKGNRQKVALVAAFARPARLYVLDEPTSGLDPVMEEVFRAEVRRVRSEGATVLLSSHILSEVEALCDRVTIIRAGQVVEEGTLAQMRHLTRSSVSVTTDAPADAIRALPGVHDLVAEDGTLRFGAEASAVAGVIAALDGHRVEALTVEPPSLEELFLRHYGREGR